MNRNSKGFALLIIVVILAFVGILAYLSYGFLARIDFFDTRSQLPRPPVSSPYGQDSTANWKSYTNTLYGYSIRYPSGAALSNNDKNSTPESSNDIFLKFQYEGDGFTDEIGPSISVSENASRFSPQEYFEQLEKESEDRGDIAPLSDRITEKHDVQVGKIQGYQIEIFSFDSQTRTTYLSNGNLIVSISYPSSIPEIPEEDYSQLLETFDQILSTFKFLPEECGECPQYSPPSADFCKDGEIVSGKTDECGCQLPPKCI